MSDFYFNGKEQIAKQSLDWRTSVLRVLLVGPGYTFNPVHDFVSEIIDELAVARKTLAGATINRRGSVISFDAEDVLYSAIDSSVGVIAAAIVYQQVGGDDDTPEDDVLIAHMDFFDEQANGGPVNVVWNSDGILRI